MKKIKILSFILVVLLGGFLFVYGEIDDSPGGQLIGLVIGIIGVVGIIKSMKKGASSSSKKS